MTIKKVAALVISAVLVLACLAGCNAAKAETPTDVVRAALDAVKVGGYDKFGDYCSGEGLINDDRIAKLVDVKADEGSGVTEDQAKLAKSLFDKALEFSYEVNGESVNGDKAEVKVNLTYFDIGSAFESVVNDFIGKALLMAFSGGSQDELQAALYTALDEKAKTMDNPGRNSEAVFSLEKVDGKWTITSVDEAGKDALLGGLVTGLERLKNNNSLWSS